MKFLRNFAFFKTKTYFALVLKQMAQKLIQLESFLPFKRLTATFKPGAVTPSSAIILIENGLNYESMNKPYKACMVTKTKKIDWVCFLSHKYFNCK